jgi:N-acetylmuramoyl-L-alanine amidase
VSGQPGNLARVKRRLLHEAVQENVAVMRGRRPAVARRRPPRPWLGPLVLGLVPAVLLAGSLLRREGEGVAVEPRSAVAAGSTPAPAVAAPAPGMAALPAEGLPAPGPLDRAVLPLSVRTVVVDAGHGGDNVGTVAPLGLVEKELTLDIASRLRRRLEEARFRVVMTRQRDEAVTLDRRAALANAARADIFVSIHLNWFEKSGRRGVETYYLGPTDDPYLTRLAAAENRDSGYSLADYRRLLEGIWADVRQGESRDLAGAVQGELHRALRGVDPEVEDRGVKTAPFVVLVATEMPAILAEVSCLSSEAEARRLREVSYRQAIAEALYAGIRSYADSRLQPDQKGS